jgi:hypothetical protein
MIARDVMTRDVYDVRAGAEGLVRLAPLPQSREKTRFDAEKRSSDRP